MRRFHKKTRGGCSQCKSRRTKCDESKPSCKLCIKRLIQCSFTTEPSSLVVIPSKQSSSSNLPSWPAISTPPKKEDTHNLPNDIDLAAKYALQNGPSDTLRLLTFFLLSTSYSISDAPSQHNLWRTIVPSLALEHPWLLSLIYAVTSLHLAILHPSMIHNASALKHHTQALALVRPQLENITPENTEALFSFSCLIPLYSFGVHNLPRDGVELEPGALFEILDVFSLLRGIAVIVKNGSAWLKDGPFGGSILPKEPDGDTKLRPEIEEALSVLATRNEELSQTVEKNVMYATAIRMLRTTFLLAAENPESMMTVIPFPIFVPQGYVRALRESEDLALVILAHYAVVLFWLRQYIWLDGWGERVIQAMREKVGEEWMGYIDWIFKEVAGKGKHLPTTLQVRKMQPYNRIGEESMRNSQ